MKTSQASSQNMEMRLLVDVQVALSAEDAEEPPSAADLTTWANHAYNACSQAPAEISLRICGRDEMTHLNETYRGKQGPTNVLSFPVEQVAEVPELSSILLGDIVVCHPVILQEAQEQGKSYPAHYAHMVTHGVLHLCGYDHQTDQDAQEMEHLETQVLTQQGFTNPYNSH